MNILCLGINHRTAPIDAREQLWFSNDELGTLLPKILVVTEPYRVREAVLVSTCNRTELYVVADEHPGLIRALLAILAEGKNTCSWISEEYFYTLTGSHAVRHLFALASGRDSMVLGDIQILNQIKNAFALGQELHTCGPVLNRMLTMAIHAGKRSRTETEIAEGAVSVGYAAAELASRIFGNLTAKSALLIGTGETGTLTAKHLNGHKLGKLFLTNRTRARAEELTAEVPGTVVEFGAFKEILTDIDIIVSSISTVDPILMAGEVREILRVRKGRPLCIIDLGMPRNIDPAIRNLENVFLHDIDDLFHIVDANLARRQTAIPRVNAIVLHEVHQFVEWYKSLRINPTIQELREQFEEIRKTELERYLSHFDPETREEVAMLTKQIVNKILHGPMVNLRAGTNSRGESEAQETIRMVRALFALDESAKMEQSRV